MKEVLQVNGWVYENVDPRRKQELSDSRMIQESGMANMPQKQVYHTFDQNKYMEHLNMYNQDMNVPRDYNG